MQQAQIEAVEQSDTEQDDRMSALENDVDTWDDRIVVLEATDRDIQDRLATLEETILSKLCILISCYVPNSIRITLDSRNNTICSIFLQYLGWHVIVHLVTIKAPALTSTSIPSFALAEMGTMEKLANTVSQFRNSTNNVNFQSLSFEEFNLSPLLFSFFCHI